MDGEPFNPPEVKRRVLEILESGSVTFSKHALEELEADKMTTVDATNILRGGWVAPGELEKGTYRYRVFTPRMCAVIAFRSETEARVVTAWREKSR